MLIGKQNDNEIKFASLGFMNRNGVSVRQILQLVKRIIDFADVKKHRYSRVFVVFLFQPDNPANIAVHNVFLAAVNELYNFVIDAEDAVIMLYLALARRVKPFLHRGVNRVYSQRPFIHWDKNLNVADQIHSPGDRFFNNPARRFNYPLVRDAENILSLTILCGTIP